jgi:hypothetical protein
MLLAIAFTVMTVAASDSGFDQQSVSSAISNEDIELLSQLEFLETWDILNSPSMDQEMKLLPLENKEDEEK